MKHTYLITIFAATAAWVLASCTKEQEAGPQPMATGQLRARIEGSGTETRVGFDAFSGKFSWTDGDVIDIHTSAGAYRQVAVDAAGNFSLPTSGSEQRDGYAVYPAGIVGGSGSGLTLTLPTSYDLDASNSMLDKAPLIAVNDPASDDLWFYHASGTIYLTLNEVPANTASIAVIFDKRVTGEFDVQTPASGHPYIETDGDATGTTVTFNLAAPLSAATDGLLVKIPVPVGNYATINAEARDGSDAALKVYHGTKPRVMYRARGRQISLPEPLEDSMQFIVTAGSGTAWEFTLPFTTTETLPADLKVTWGDGTFSEAAAGSTVSSVADALKHTYSTPGNYTITLTAKNTDPDGYMIPWLQFGKSQWTFQRTKKMLKSIPTPLLYMNGDGHSILRYCENLETINSELFSKNKHFTNLSNAFGSCESLQALPDRLFDNCTNVTDFSSTFSWCTSLQTIPTGLFDKCTNASTFQSTFSGCDNLTAIPNRLFDHCPNVTKFSYTFYRCSGLTEIPRGLFDHNPNVTSFESVFQNCSNLEAIPIGLFDHNPNVTSFFRAFSDCSSLTGPIPTGLFDHCPNVQDFAQAFTRCPGLTTIPVGLFDYCTKARTFESMFYECAGLTAIPDGLFDKCTNATSFSSTFMGCTSLTAIPVGLFDHCPNITNVQYTFSGCDHVTAIPVGLFDHCPQKRFTGTFQNCSSLTAIPPGIFDKSTEAWDFEKTFMGCSGITAIPDGLFDKCKASEFVDVFNGCSSLRAIPTGIFDHCSTRAIRFTGVFRECTSLTSIPAGLFDNFPEATAFGYAFYGCTGLTGSIPSGLFSHNPKAYIFQGTFAHCSSLEIVADLFTGGTSYTASNRFSSYGDHYNFKNCFEGVAGGTAPNIWQYTYRVDPYGTECFKDATGLSNYGAIPDNWK